MTFASRRRAAAAAGLSLLATLASAQPAAAFRIGQSPDFPGCAVWLNDAGQPLRARTGREIGRKVPCLGRAQNRDAYETLFGEAPGTLVIRDSTHHVECLMALAPGSTTVMVQKVCQAWNG